MNDTQRREWAKTLKIDDVVRIREGDALLLCSVVRTGDEGIAVEVARGTLIFAADGRGRQGMTLEPATTAEATRYRLTRAIQAATTDGALRELSTPQLQMIADALRIGR